MTLERVSSTPADLPITAVTGTKQTPPVQAGGGHEILTPAPTE